MTPRRARLERLFAARFGGPAAVRARAPGRIDLMGSHTDYNEGFVLALALDRDTCVLAAPRTDERVRVASTNLDAVAQLSLANDPSARDGWARHVAGVVRAYADAGFACAGFDALVDGTVPIASGLSSSASLEVAVALVVEQLGGHSVAPLERARLCQRAENDWVGVACGILDPYCAVFGRTGHALAIDCRALTHRTVALPPGLAVVVGDTRAPRELAGSAYGERRAQCEAGARALAAHVPGVRALRDVSLADFERHEAALPRDVARRCRFVVEEDARVGALARALEAGDRAELGRLLAASFAGARDLYEICIPEMEAMEAALRAAPGCIGARQAGAGFGGCLVALAERDRVDELAAAAAHEYTRRCGRVGSVYSVAAGDGAGPL